MVLNESGATSASARDQPPTVRRALVDVDGTVADACRILANSSVELQRVADARAPCRRPLPMSKISAVDLDEDE